MFSSRREACPMNPSSFPRNPTCALCAKPIRPRSGGYIRSTTGNVYHIRCRSRELQLTALEEYDGPAPRVEEATDRQRAPLGRRSMRGAACPVCGERATLTDWRSQFEWIAVEGCPCRGFFVWTPLLDAGRLLPLSREDRGILSQRIRALRATQSNVWLSTRDGTVLGALTIGDEPPDRPTSP